MSFTNDYLTNLEDILIHGETDNEDRTGVGTVAMFNLNLECDMSDGEFPIIESRRVALRIAFEELMWMLRGQTDVSILQEKDIHIWDGNTTREALDKYGKQHIKENTIGKGYSYQFRNFNGVDQLKNVIEGIKRNPSSRRHVISLWNPSDLNDMSLEPCHVMYTFTKVGNTLNLHQQQRSADCLLGIPTNMMFAGLFLMLVCKYTGLKIGSVANTSVNAHIYNNHIKATEKMLDNWYNNVSFPHESKTRVSINKDINTFDDLLATQWEDIEVSGYNPVMKLTREELPMAV